MKKISAYFFLVLALLVLYDLTPNLKFFVDYQLASVLNFNTTKVLDWSSSKGFQEDLVYGDRGIHVSLLQYALSVENENYPSKYITGYFGEQTQKGIIEFQEKNNLEISGYLDESTREKMNQIFLDELCPQGRYNTNSDPILVKVDKTNTLPLGYIPHDLIDISNTINTKSVICVKQEVVPYLQKMTGDAKEANLDLIITSGFRSPEVQSHILNLWLKIIGEKAKDRVAEPNHSEHQLGTTIDISGSSIEYKSADNSFGDSPEYEWLSNNAHKYGFLMSYPKGKEEITGYEYEPWHYRYIGTELANFAYEKGYTIKELLGMVDILRNRKTGQ